MDGRVKSIISVGAIVIAGVSFSLLYLIPPTKDTSKFQQQLYENQGTLNVHVMEAKRKQEQVMAALQRQAGLSTKDK